jgi:hypothetical protein
MLFHRQLFSSNSHWSAFFISCNQSILRLISFQKHDEKTTVFRDHCFQEFGPWFLPKEMNANRFFWDSHWLEIWSNHFYPSMGPNGGSVAMDSGPSGYLWKSERDHKLSNVRKSWEWISTVGLGNTINDHCQHVQTYSIVHCTLQLEYNPLTYFFL